MAAKHVRQFCFIENIFKKTAKKFKEGTGKVWHFRPDFSRRIVGVATRRVVDYQFLRSRTHPVGQNLKHYRENLLRSVSAVGRGRSTECRWRGGPSAHGGNRGREIMSDLALRMEKTQKGPQSRGQQPDILTGSILCRLE